LIRGNIESRLTFGLHLFGILALLVSIIILFAAVERLGHNRKQMALTSDVSQVLVELKQQTSVQQANDIAYSDGIARLIAYGDVQTGEIAALSGNGLFGNEEVDLKIAKKALSQTWNAVKKTFATGYSSTGDAAVLDNSTPQVLLQEYAQLRKSFDDVFAAISQDTLSADLLTANSQLLATLKNLDFVLNVRQSLDSVAYMRILQDNLSLMRAEVAQLVSLTTAASGSVLIGYETRQLLTGFVQLAENFQPVQLVAPASPWLRVREEQELLIENAIGSVSTYQRMLELASHQNRRAILIALSALCFALICLMASLWRILRNQTGGDATGNPELELLRAELTAIADGDLSVRASQQSGATQNAIAQAVNHTVEMLTGLVRVFRRAGNHLNELAMSQQHLAKRWIKSEIKRHEQLELLSQSLELQTQAVNELHELESQTLSTDTAAIPLPMSPSGSQGINQIAGCTRAAIQELSVKVSACRDLLGTGDMENSASAAKIGDSSSEGLLRMRQRVHELTGTISAVRLAAEQARLQVLNTSLQMTAYAGTAEIDDQSRLVEDIQNISNQLALSAAGAERMSSVLADDLQQYADTFASDKHNLLIRFDQLQQSVNACLDVPAVASVELSPLTDAAIESDRAELMVAALENIQHQQVVLQQLVVELRSQAEIASDGDAIELLEQISEIQKVSASLAKSAELYGGTAND